MEKLLAFHLFRVSCFKAFGAYPWQVVLLAANDAYQGSGVLIDHVHVLTAAHKVSAYL